MKDPFNLFSLRMLKVLGYIALLLFSSALFASDLPKPYLFKDLNTKPSESDPSDLVVMNGVMYFAAETRAAGRELWRSDGTPEGTYLLKDTASGTSYGSADHLTVVGDTIYFSAQDRTHRYELWKTDGTVEGTEMVKDIRVGSSASSPASFFAFNGEIFFTADDGIHGRELWKSDGTEAGTVLVKDILPGSGSGVGWNHDFSEPIEGFVYFKANDGIHGEELWRTDGTPAGTVMIMDIYPGSQSSQPSGFIEINERILFSATDGVNGRELWETDGTSLGTSLFLDIRAGTSGGSPWNFVTFNGYLYFTAWADGFGQEIWRSDGTLGGTELFYDVWPGNSSSNAGNFTVSGSTMFFTAFTANSQGTELWKTDGTGANTEYITTPTPGSYNNFLGNGFTLNGLLYFANVDNERGVEIWRTDGTDSGTQLFADIHEGPGNSNPRYFTHFDGQVFFSADDGLSGRELWVTDGTILNTSRLIDINPGTERSNPSGFFIFNNEMYFSASLDSSAIDLWKSDGSEVNTQLFFDFKTGRPTDFTLFGDNLVFSARDFTTGTEVWSTDGTTEGTSILFDLAPGSSSSHPRDFWVKDHKFFYLASKPETGLELFASDGTLEGTSIVKDIVPGSSSPNINEFTKAGANFFFRAQEPNTGTDLWVSDGTNEGTFSLDLVPGADSSWPRGIKELNGRAIFVARDPETNRNKLWISDGTNLGTKIIHSGSINSIFDSALLNGKLYFSAAGTDNSGSELWSTDGTIEGTHIVKDLIVGTESSNPSLITKVGNHVYFFTRSSQYEFTLWISDGTEDGTSIVDNTLGVSYWTTRFIFESPNGEYLYYALNRRFDGLHELWRTDGTPHGTVQLTNPSLDSGPKHFPNDLVEVSFLNDLAFFAAENEYGDRELYALDVSGSGSALLPTANAGTDLDLFDADNDGIELVQLNGAGSLSGDAPIVSYLWEWQDGGLQTATGVNPTISLPLGTTAVTLTVTDDSGDTDSDTVNITVSIPSFPVFFDLDGKGTRTEGGLLNQDIQINQDASEPLVSGLLGWLFTGWDRAFTNITSATTVTALYTADIDNVQPDQDATVSDDRTAPPADSPPATIEVGSLTLEDGGSFALGPNETLVLNDGPLTIQDGAIFEGNGSIVGDILNFGLMIIRVTEQLIFPSIDNRDGAFVNISRDSGGSSGNPPPVIPEVSNDAVFSTDGSLEVTGSFTQGSTGKLRLFIEGDDPGVTYSQLSVGDNIDLDGEVQLVIGQATFDEFYMIPGKTFDVVRVDPASVGKTLTAQAGLGYRILALQSIATELSGQGLSSSAFDSGYANDPDDLVELAPSLFTWSVVDNSILRATYVGPGTYLIEPEIASTTRELSEIGGGIFSGLDLSFDTIRVLNSNTGKVYEFVFGDLNREVDFSVTEITESAPVPNQDTLGAVELDTSLTDADSFDLNIEVGEGLDETKIEFWRAASEQAVVVADFAESSLLTKMSADEEISAKSGGAVLWEKFTPTGSSYSEGTLTFSATGDFSFYAATLPNWSIDFDLGVGEPSGLRTGGGALNQVVGDGEDAVAPEFDVSEGYVFVGWNASYLNVSEDRTVIALFAVDSDADGIPDDFENTNFGGLGIASESSDRDKDGALDIEEWRAGTDPDDAADRFNAEPQSPPSGTFTLRWTGKPGRAYTVSRAATLGDTFTPISGPVEAPLLEAEMSFEDKAAPTGGSFYIISVQKILD
jgi:ELWxxDGT repeat protein